MLPRRAVHPMTLCLRLPLLSPTQTLKALLRFPLHHRENDMWPSISSPDDMGHIKHLSYPRARGECGCPAVVGLDSV